jgi:hypothetical protein
MDFSAALDQKVEEVEKPLDPPQGTYCFAVSKVPVISRTKKGDWDIVEFPVTGVHAEADVDEDQLEAFGGATKVKSRVSFMFPTDEDADNDRAKSMANMRKFMERTLRVELEEDMTIRQMLDASANHQFLAQVEWTPKENDPEENFINLRNWAPLD